MGAIWVRDVAGLGAGVGKSISFSRRLSRLDYRVASRFFDALRTIVRRANFRHNLGFSHSRIFAAVACRLYLASCYWQQTHVRKTLLMISEKIEKIKSEYTDKYVVVQAEQPELARFKEYVGQVKTVNMNGRALVEFGEFNQNIGWYDIELDYLKVVDKPSKKEPQAKESKKAAPAAKGPAAKGPKNKSAASGEKKLSPLELARQQGAAKSSGVTSAQKPKSTGATKSTGAAGEKKSASKPPSGKLSTSDILAAARGGSAKKTAESKSVKSKSTDSKSTGEESSPSATPKSAGSSPAQGGKLSTADILAAARGGSVKSSAQEKNSETEAESEPDTAVEVATESAAPSGPIDKSSMTPDEMCAWCREHDAG